MSHTVPLAEAGAQLNKLIARLGQDDEVVLTQDDKPVAKIVPVGAPPRRRGFGAGKGSLVILADDDEHLKDFEEYM